ncbi:MAG: hypothetical protein MJ208_02880 [Bacilli bacterium]|nr:hypothetical protein [Bacilli bacterium]
MNNLSLSILTLLHYNVIVRDTLEYALNHPNYDIKPYQYKKKGVMIEIEQPTALKQFIDKNAEIGKKVTEEIKALYAAIYADDSTICHVSGTELRVDHGQHIAIYDVVFPLHEDVKKIVDAHLGFARKNNLLEDQLMRLVAADERMYRAVAFTCLYRDLERLFVEYNKARNEAKGEITPQSNFIQGELLKIVNHIKFMRDNQSATDEEYWNMVDYVIKTVDQTSGRRALPKDKKFKDIFDEGRKIIGNFLMQAEKNWKELYEPAIKELLEKAKNSNNQIKVDVANQANKEEKKN